MAEVESNQNQEGGNAETRSTVLQRSLDRNGRGIRTTIRISSPLLPASSGFSCVGYSVTPSS